MILLIVLVLACLAWGSLKVARVIILAGNISADAKELSSLTESGSFSAFQSSPGPLTSRLFSLKNDLHDIHTEIGPLAYIGVILGWVPHYGGDIAQAPWLLDYADNTADGAYTTLVLFEGVSADVDAGRLEGKSVGVSALAALEKHSAEINKARQELEGSRAARKALDVDRLGASTRGFVDRLDRLLPLWSTAVNAFALAPDLLGANGPKDLLLIIQNSDELRATGGFVSSVVNIRMDHGDIAELEYRDSYALDNPSVTHLAAPAPLQKYMGAEFWAFRDANWSPDFPTAARSLLDSYVLDQGGSPAGIVATNLNMLADLLQTLGPINVEGSKEKVSSSNALTIIQSYYDSPEGQGHTADWWSHRKDFAGKLLVSALENIRNGQFDKTQFIHLLSQSIESKELLFYLSDPRSQEIVDSAGWSGRISADGGDSLMIVDSNLGFNKVDPHIQRRANYSVYIDEAGSATAQLTLQYANSNRPNNAGCVHAPYYPPTYAEMQQGCYWDYVRILGAPEARLISSSPNIEAGAEDPIAGRSVFQGYFVLPRGATQQLQYHYQIPNAVLDGRTYHLRIQKQPGAPAWAVNVKVAWASAGNLESDPTPARVTGQVLEYDLVLDKDLDILIVRPASPLPSLVLSIGSAALSLTLVGAWWIRRRANKGQSSRGPEQNSRGDPSA